MRRSWSRSIGGSTSRSSLATTQVKSSLQNGTRPRRGLRHHRGGPGTASLEERQGHLAALRPGGALTRRPGVSDLASDQGAHPPSCRVPLDGGAAVQAKLMSFAYVEQGGGSPGASRLAATGRSLQAWH